MTNRKFVIECVDAHTGSIKSDLLFEFDNEVELCNLIAPGDCEIFLNEIYDLSKDELAALRKNLGVVFDAPVLGQDTVTLRVARHVDLLPYKVHTNRELTLMLDGGKPMSMFTESLPNDTGVELIPEKYFLPYVLSGKFVKREYIEISDLPRKTRIVYFSKASEEWRIDAHILIRETAGKIGWSEGFERLEGSLLGYEEWQNDCYIEQIYKPRLQENRRNSTLGD